jgi:hypothetical protein
MWKRQRNAGGVDVVVRGRFEELGAAAAQWKLKGSCSVHKRLRHVCNDYVGCDWPEEPTIQP